MDEHIGHEAGCVREFKDAGVWETEKVRRKDIIGEVCAVLGFVVLLYVGLIALTN